METEAAVVRFIFDWYVNKGMAQIPIASMLNEQHYRTRKGLWHSTRVWAVLIDGRYTGKDEHFTYPPIIGEDLYEAAQRKRKEARHILRNPGQHLLQGFVVCGLCGHRVSPRQWRRSGYRIPLLRQEKDCSSNSIFKVYPAGFGRGLAGAGG